MTTYFVMALIAWGLALWGSVLNLGQKNDLLTNLAFFIHLIMFVWTCVVFF